MVIAVGLPVVVFGLKADVRGAVALPILGRIVSAGEASLPIRRVMVPGPAATLAFGFLIVRILDALQVGIS